MGILAILLVSESLRFILGRFANGIRAYAKARKSMHFVVHLTILMAEFFVIFILHDIMAHVILATSIFTWEAVLVQMVED